MRKIHVRVTNRVAYLRQPYPHDKLLRFWSYSFKGFRFIRQRYLYFDREEQKWKLRWDGRVKLLKRDQVPAGLFWATYRDIEKELKVKFKIERELRKPKLRDEEDWLVSDKAHYYQNETAGRMTMALGFGGGLVLNATASGKTRAVALLCSRIKGKVCFIVDQLDLLEQARQELRETLKEPIGIVGMSKFKPRRITVATIQTLSKHKSSRKYAQWISKIKVLIIDEIHVQMNRSNFGVVEKITPLAVFGLTATLGLKRKDVRLRAFALAGPVLYQYPIEQGQKDAVLARGVCVRIKYPNAVPARPTAPDRSKSFYNDVYREKIVENLERNYILAELAKEARKRGYYFIGLVQRIQHLKEIGDRLRKVPHRLVWGEKDIEFRNKARRKFEEGKVKIIFANTVFKKGVNIKRVDVIADGAGLKSKEDAVQKYGRGVRQHGEKRGLIYFDVADYQPIVRGRRHKKNKLAKAAVSRKNAFKAEKIPVFDIEWEGDIEEVFDFAEKSLKKVLKEAA
jgi:superfamily II DNA or RNA helicase